MKKPYIRISPDIDVLCINSDSCCASAYGDEICNDSPWLGPRFNIVVPGIEEWVKRYEYATDFAETTTEPSFDWISWHYEGLCFAKAIQAYVNESFVIFPDWGGCIFWDTMGVGSGDYNELSTDNGDFKLNVLGLQKWGDFYDNNDNRQTFEQWWQEGWKLAKEIRRQLPARIDL